MNGHVAENAGRADRKAAVLAIPFVAWLGFATLLAERIWERNPTHGRASTDRSQLRNRGSTGEPAHRRSSAPDIFASALRRSRPFGAGAIALYGVVAALLLD